MKNEGTVKCKAIKNDGTQCTKDALPASEYCGTHKYEELKETFRKSEKKSIGFNIIFTLIAIIIGFHISQQFFIEGVENSRTLSEKSFNDTIKLSESSLNKTFLMTTPVILQVNDTVNETEGRWYINVTNTHPLKETGAIYLYRLEKNPLKPHMSSKKGLKPGESKIYNLSFDFKEESIDFSQEELPYALCGTVPYSKLYFIFEHISITFKITCDNCPSQGIIRRLPEFGAVHFSVVLTNENISKIEVPTYEWVDYNLEDVLRNKTVPS